MMDKEEEKEYQKEFGINLCLDDCVESLKNEFELSKAQIAKILRERASEVNPRKRVAYCLPDGTEISREEYLKLKKIFGSKVNLKASGKP